MSLDKAIAAGKEKRRERRGCGGSCNGFCAWCREGRMFSGRKITVISKLEVREFEKYGKGVA